MYIKNISLKNYRNYENQEISLNKKINIIYGNNAQGKTNIIESIILCSLGKSFRSKKDKDLIRFNENFSEVSIDYAKSDRDGNITVDINDKKTFFVNGVKQKKTSDILGKINIVTFTPDDIDIIKGSPEERRKFLDMMISSLKPNYVHNLLNYKNVLEQRNNYLRKIKYEKADESLLEVYDEQLSDYAEKVYEYRKYFIDKIDNKIENIHNLIIDKEKEKIKIKYNSQFINKEDYYKKLVLNRKIDAEKGFTSIGIHRDDFVIYINNKSVGVYGSQGQKRTSVLTLKLCELEIVKEEIEDTPVLLLDDFMSELDDKRRERFLENIEGNQVILTGTNKIDIKNDSSIFYIENGIIKVEK